MKIYIINYTYIIHYYIIIIVFLMLKNLNHFVTIIIYLTLKIINFDYPNISYTQTMFTSMIQYHKDSYKNSSKYPNYYYCTICF